MNQLPLVMLHNDAYVSFEAFDQRECDGAAFGTRALPM